MLAPPSARTRAMPLGDTLMAIALRNTLRLLLKPALSPRWPLRWQRRWLDILSGIGRLPRGIARCDGTEAGVAVERWEERAAVARPADTLLFLHGGAYCVGSPRTHRALAAWLARDDANLRFTLAMLTELASQKVLDYPTVSVAVQRVAQLASRA